MRTSSELSTTIGLPEPIVNALANGYWVRYRSGTGSMSSVLKTCRCSTQIPGSCSWPSFTAEPSEAARSARS